MDPVYSVGLGVAAGAARGVLGMVTAWRAAPQDFQMSWRQFGTTLVLAAAVGGAAAYTGVADGDIETAMAGWLGSELITKIGSFSKNQVAASVRMMNHG